MHWFSLEKKSDKTSVVDPNTFNFDPDPGFWPNLDLDPGPDPGLKLNQCFGSA